MAEQNIGADALAASRREKAVKLRARGATWPEIVRVCGYESTSQAFKDVGAAMAEATQRASQTADSLRDEAQLRLDYLLSEAMGLIGTETATNLEGESVGTDGRLITLRAIDEARRLIDAKAKMDGIAVPAKEESADEVPVIRIIREG